MRTIIVDDEPLARSRLKRLLSQHKNIELIGEATNAKEALAKSEQLKPDLVILDIEMPGDNGLIVAEALNKLKIPPAIIFITAHAEHALNAYSVGPTDYILKPVDPIRLATALDRLGTHTRAHLERNEEMNPWIHFQIGNNNKRIRFKNILYFMAEDKVVKMVTDDGEAIVDYTLKQLEEKFQSLVIRTHRSILINSQRIEGIKKNHYGKASLLLKNFNQELPISRRHLSHLKELIKSST